MLGARRVGAVAADGGSGFTSGRAIGRDGVGENGVSKILLTQASR